MAEDYLSTLSSNLELEKAYGVLTELKILDPTCGSGAFLFAALEVLSDMYTAIIDRAEELSSNHDPPAFLTEVQKHPSVPYFVLKTAMLKNLYGLDLMPEAGEIARLRLFLKLAAQLEQKEQIEPLPDLDFNIKSGNLLVGIADEGDAEQRLVTDLLGFNQLGNIRETASTYIRTYNDFIEAQEKADNPERVAHLKSALNQHLSPNRDELDNFLHKTQTEQTDFNEWKESHRPFHWFIEFPQVHQAGGFDVVIGNPPYIRAKQITKYTWKGYKTNDLPDIYAPCLERALHLTKSGGRLAMILPISFQFSNQYEIARKAASSSLRTRWISTFARRPSQLFPSGIGVRSSIILGNKARNQDAGCTYVSRLNRWTSEYRDHLFFTLSYTKMPEQLNKQVNWLRIASEHQADLLKRLLAEDFTLLSLSNKGKYRGEYRLYYKSDAGYYLSTFLDKPPAKTPCGKPVN